MRKEKLKAIKSPTLLSSIWCTCMHGNEMVDSVQKIFQTLEVKFSSGLKKNIARMQWLCSQTLSQQSVQELYIYVPVLNMVSVWWSSDPSPLSFLAWLLLPDVMNWLLLMDVTSWWFCCLCSSGCEFLLPPHPIL